MICSTSRLARLLNPLRQLGQRTLYLNAYALIGSNLLTAAASYLFWILAARRFTDEAVGIASAMLSSMALLDVLASLGLESGLIRFLPTQEDVEASNHMLQVATTLRLAAALITTLAFIAGLSLWAPGLPSVSQANGLWMLFVLLTLANGAYNLLNAAFIALRKARYVFTGSLIFNTVKLGIVAVIPSATDAPGVLTAVTVGLFSLVLIELLVFLPALSAGFRPRLSLALQSLRGFFNYSVVNQLADVLLGLPQMLLPLFVINTLGASANARFYTAWMTAGVLRTACISIAQSAFAEGSAAVHQPGTLHTSIKHSLGLSLLALLGGGGLLAVSGRWVLLLFGKSYSEEGTRLLYWLLVSVLPFSLMNLYLTTLRIRKQTALLLAISAAWATISLSGTWLGMRAEGLTGIAMGWTIAQFTALLLVIPLGMGEQAQIFQTKMTHREETVQ
ncbi:MAG: hypothetical protein RBT47_11090 [Anaerolineae bacterium]|jgi:O-antigen/teichoic acid export membrane protein|nr:hypothetical protein [Anaerolineae bacterium]